MSRERHGRRRDGGGKGFEENEEGMVEEEDWVEEEKGEGCRIGG